MDKSVSAGAVHGLPIIVRETVPLCMPIPDMVEVASCHVICWNSTSLQDQDGRDSTVRKRDSEGTLQAMSNIVYVLAWIVICLWVLLFASWVIRHNYQWNPVRSRWRRENRPFKIFPSLEQWWPFLADLSGNSWQILCNKLPLICVNSTFVVFWRIGIPVDLRNAI
jgi:hypothetical protein